MTEENDNSPGEPPKEPPVEVKTDFTVEYGMQLKRFRPWALYLVIVLCIFLTGPFILLGLDVEPLTFEIFLMVCFMLLFPAILPVMKAVRCPACGGFMGRSPGSFCPLCAVQIREEKEPENG
ncbi:MAG: hypothetical protein GY754_10195 [bacterium]|nr:hypothetical protein [bacterium]